MEVKEQWWLGKEMTSTTEYKYSKNRATVTDRDNSGFVRKGVIIYKHGDTVREVYNSNDSKTTITYSYRKIKTKQYKQAKAQQEIMYYLY